MFSEQIAALKAEITSLKERRNAVILAHVYQRGEVQEVADYTGDSLGLSRQAVETEAEVIVFCGVEFMAETAAILNPEKTVLLPAKQAECPLAEMATAKAVREKRASMPQEARVVSYVNTTAAVKAVSDICCTSSNAVDVVKSLGSGPILFVPDRNLGRYTSMINQSEIDLWDGYCYVHENIRVETIRDLQRLHPSAEVMVHPECPPPVIQQADFVGSTGQMLEYASNSASQEFIVGTEDGIFHRLTRENPQKEFYPVGTVCHGMKAITLRKVRDSLAQMQYTVHIPEKIQANAKRALDRMLAM